MAEVVDPGNLPEVIDAETVSALADHLIVIGNAVVGALSDAYGTWGALRAVFDVEGADGVHSMLERPKMDAIEFSRALSEARTVMWDAATLTLPDLKARRDELAARIATVNAAYEDADAAWRRADAAYWAQARADRDSPSTDAAKRVRTDAEVARSSVSGEADALRDEIERFRQDVDWAEGSIASQLNNIAGGSDVHGVWGERVRVSRSYWGYVDAPYPGAPLAATTTQTYAERLSSQLSTSVAKRIEWLASAAPDEVLSWMAGHRDFASAVGFVDPTAAAKLWQDLAAASAPYATDSNALGWDAGPLAHLLAYAPLVVGNLNGAPAAQRNLFTQEGLAGLLADDDLDDGAREKLQALSTMLLDDTRAHLLSVFVDIDGVPRATVAWGDVDTADQVTTLSHGIQTDLASLGAWGGSGVELKKRLDEQLRDSGSPAETAVVLFMEWDSGDGFTVQGNDRPDAGAARLSQLVGGFVHSNSGAQQNIVAHSLGTSMAGQAIADNPGLIDNAWFFGSAGVTREAQDALASQISEGSLRLNATHSSSDYIAPFGRSEMASHHPVDPRDIAGVREFVSDGGIVAGYGPDSPEGEPTEGHNSHRSQEWYYWGIDWPGTDFSTWSVPRVDTESTGYLDRNSQSFKQLVVDLANAQRLVGMR